MPRNISTPSRDSLPPSKPRGKAAADTESAHALFQAAVADVVPLTFDRIHHEPVPPPPIPRQRLRDEHTALRESLSDRDPLALALEGGDEPAYLRPGMSPRVQGFAPGSLGGAGRAGPAWHEPRRSASSSSVVPRGMPCTTPTLRAHRAWQRTRLTRTYPGAQAPGAQLVSAAQGSARLLPGT